MATAFHRRTALGCLAVSVLAPNMARAQSPWPNKPIRLIVPYPAGGSPDSMSRVVGDQLGRILGTSVVVENRPGGSAIVGFRAMTAQPADQHTLVYASSGHVTVSAISPQFDLLRESRLITRMTNSPFVLVVHSDSPYQNLQDLLKAIAAQPGKISYGSAGQGSPAHMAVEYLAESIAGFNANHIPFKGAVESANAILGKQIDFTIGVLGALITQVQAGKLRALGVTTSTRIAGLPQIPTIAEAGVPAYQYSAWGGLAMHKDTTDAVVLRMHQAITEACNTEAVRSHVQRNAGLLDLSDSPKNFTAAVEKEVAAERRIVKRLGLTM